jgi:hypothetical protein
MERERSNDAVPLSKEKREERTNNSLFTPPRKKVRLVKVRAGGTVT